MSTPAQHAAVVEPSSDAAPLRFVTAASLFDGHDAAINIMRRLIQAQGAEVIHLGHNRAVEDVVRAALQEDADAIALSSLPGRPRRILQVHGRHAEASAAPAHVRVFGGGGGTITPEEIARAAGLRRRAHLPPERRHAPGPRRDDRGRRARARSEHRARRPSGRRQGRHSTTRSSIGRDAVGRSRTARSTKPSSRACARNGSSPAARRRSSASPAPAARASRQRRRRTAAALPARVPGHAHRGARGRSDAAPLRRRAARRPHPHELAALQARVHALDGDAPPARGDEHRAEGLHRVPEGRWATTSSSSRPPASASRDSEIVDLVDFPMYVMTSDYGAAEPAREDRHARFRRARRAQQVRQARRRRRAARRAQAVEAQPHRVQAQGRGRAGLSDDRQPVQRSGRHLDVRQPVPAAARETARCRRTKWTPRRRHHAEGAARHRADPRRARALSRRDRRAGPRHQRARSTTQAEAADRAQAMWQALHEIERSRSCRRRSTSTTPTDCLVRRSSGQADGRSQRCSPCASATTTRCKSLEHRSASRCCANGRAR